MSKTTSYAAVLAGFSVPTGGTKTSPGKSTGSIDLRANYGTGMTVAIANGSSAPDAPMQAQIQVSGDGTTWRDFGVPLVGDKTASSSYSWSVDIPKQYLYAQVIAFGNTTNAVSLSVEVEACTGL